LGEEGGNVPVGDGNTRRDHPASPQVGRPDADHLHPADRADGAVDLGLGRVEPGTPDVERWDLERVISNQQRWSPEPKNDGLERRIPDGGTNVCDRQGRQFRCRGSASRAAPATRVLAFRCELSGRHHDRHGRHLAVTQDRKPASDLGTELIIGEDGFGL